jgi:hypothetical protein
MPLEIQRCLRSIIHDPGLGLAARPPQSLDSLGLVDIESDNTVYALDSSTNDLGLSVFDWAPFRSTKAAVNLHTFLDLRGAIPAFIHVSDGKLHYANVLDILPVEAGAFYVMDRGYADFERMYAMHQAGAYFVTRATAGMDACRLYSHRADRTRGVICDQRVMLNGFYPAKDKYGLDGDDRRAAEAAERCCRAH